MLGVTLRLRITFANALVTNSLVIRSEIALPPADFWSRIVQREH